MPISMRDRSGEVHAFVMRGTPGSQNRLQSYRLVEPMNIPGSASQKFFKKYKLRVGDGVAICLDSAGDCVIECDTADFPSPVIRAELGGGSPGGPSADASPAGPETAPAAAGGGGSKAR